MKKNYIKYSIIAIIGLFLYFLAYFFQFVPCKLIIEPSIYNEIWTFCTVQESPLLSNLIVLIICFLVSWIMTILILRGKRPKTFNQKPKVLAPIKKSKKWAKKNN